MLPDGPFPPSRHPASPAPLRQEERMSGLCPSLASVSPAHNLGRRTTHPGSPEPPEDPPEKHQVSSKCHRTAFPSLLINSRTTSLSIMKHKLIINKLMINNTYVMNNTLILQAFEHLLPLTEGNLISWLQITEGECFRRVWEVWEGVGHLNVAGTSPCKGVKCLRSLVAQN